MSMQDGFPGKPQLAEVCIRKMQAGHLCLVHCTFGPCCDLGRLQVRRICGNSPNSDSIS